MRRAARLLALGLLALTAACATSPTGPYRVAPQPEAPGYLSAVPAGTTAYDNRDLAELLVRLTFHGENGNPRPKIHRLQEPISVGLSGPGSDQYRAFLSDFLRQLGSEAGIDVALGPPPYGIHIRFVPGELYRAALDVSCNFIFWQPTWEALVRNPSAGPRNEGGSPAMGIFIPDTNNPSKVRKCLIEETTQSLGPINDLFGLGPTIFNDDGGHVWPTRLDYLMLKVLYDSDMDPSGDKAGVRAQALAILDRVNPQGRGAPPLPSIRQDAFQPLRDRIVEILRAERGTADLAEARDIARRARQDFPNTAYACAADTIVAKTAGENRVPDAHRYFDRALDVCRRVHGDDDPRVAWLLTTGAFALLDEDRYAEALEDAEAALPILVEHGNDEWIAVAKTAIMLARRQTTNERPDPEVIRDLRRWLAYALGADHELLGKLDF